MREHTIGEREKNQLEDVLFVLSNQVMWDLNTNT